MDSIISTYICVTPYQLAYHTYPCIKVLLQSIKRKYLIEPVFVCDLDNFCFNKIIMESAKKRKYNEDYIKYGFRFILKDGQELPQCVVCCKVLFDGSMKPSFLKRHLSGCHPDLATKEQQIVAEILGAPLNTFSIQLDESTDVSICAQLLVFARYIKDGDFHEKLLFCQCLETSTKGEDIF